MHRSENLWALTATLLWMIAGPDAGAASAAVAAAATGKACARQVYIDAGHEPAAPGATSAGGTAEYDFNWRLAGDVAARLKAQGWATRFVVQRGENVSLAARGQRISRLRQGFLVSLHHDSVQPQFLVRSGQKGGAGPLSLHARGYALFVKTDGAVAQRSTALARAIGTQVRLIPLKPNASHAENVAGERRAWVDSQLGIYAFNGLAVLRASQIPAVLIEAAVIVNPLDEAWISKAANRDLFASAIAAGLDIACPAAATVVETPMTTGLRPMGEAPSARPAKD